MIFSLTYCRTKKQAAEEDKSLAT